MASADVLSDMASKTLPSQYKDSNGRTWTILLDPATGQYVARLQPFSEAIADSDPNRLTQRIEADVYAKYKTPHPTSHLLLAGGAGLVLGYLAHRMMNK